jgi:hypothetical protein
MIKQYLQVLPTLIMIATLACGLSAFANELKDERPPGIHNAQGGAVAAPRPPDSQGQAR